MIDNAADEEFQLNPIGPQLGDCFGPILFPPGKHLDAITATYTPSGVGSLIFNVNGIDSVTLGAQNQVVEPDVEITRWTFSRE